jgi:hypothetical protein
MQESAGEESARACHVAVLLVGRLSTQALSLHAPQMMQNIIEPLSADVFVVTDNETTPEWAHTEVNDRLEDNVAHVLPHMLRHQLRAFATYGEPPGALRRAAAAAHSPFSLTALARPRLHVVKRRSWLSWLKLGDAWHLMEAHEATKRWKYAAVVRLRSDVTPVVPAWSRSALCALQANDPSSVYALSDHVLVGARGAMAVAAGLHAAILPIFDRFVGEWAGMGAKPFSVTHALASALATHPCAFERRNMFYNKLASLPLRPLLPPVWSASATTGEWRAGGLTGGLATDAHDDSTMELSGSHAISQEGEPADGTAARARLVDALRRARTQHWVFIDPRAMGAPPLVDTLTWPPNRSRIDELNVGFSSETGFIAWLLAHNVSVKELALLTRSTRLLWKGEVFERPLDPDGAHRCATPTAQPPAAGASAG